MNKIALITGGTSGIGAASARKFASEGWDLIITGRRKDRLDNIRTELTSEYNIDVLCLHFDVRNLEDVKKHISGLEGKWTKVELLLNNAGLAVGRGEFQNGVYDDWERMIDTNVKGLIYMSKEMAPVFIKNGKGHIINIASMAGHEVYGGGNVYCATKHAVRALSKGMRIDMIEHGIKVSIVSPGAVDETEFSLVRYKGDQDKAVSTYDGYEPLHASNIADCVWFCANQPPNVNIEEVYVLPTAQASPYVLHKKDI
jgi:3-hydroxy acid dehydrogenase / malonic semialdehyde reductase